MTRHVLAVHPGGRATGFHDPAAAVFEDGQLVFGAEEERFIRVKHADGTFPERAIQAGLDNCGIDLPDIETVVVPWEPTLRWNKMDGAYLRDAIFRETSLPVRLAEIARYAYWSRSPESVVGSIRDRLRSLGTPVPDIETAPHHRCHAASAFYPSGLNEALVLTIDGQGEYDATVVWRGDADGVERVRTYKAYNSLGGLYGAVTEFLGFRAYNGEGKVMGLAPYGDRNYRIESKLRSVIDTGAEYDVSAISGAGTTQGAKRLESVLGRERTTDTGSFSDWEKDLAYTIQHLLEEIVTDIVAEYASELGTTNLCLAGGVALNCKMNKRLLEMDGIQEVFIQPVAHDAGTTIGAGLLESDPTEVPRFEDVYFGVGYSQSDIIDRLEMNRIPYHEPDEPLEYVADALAEGKLVGWFDGRFEMGPRALGARSILADPRSVDSRDRVNERVKHRETWRPFAPSMLEEAADRYLVNAESSPFMIQTFDVVEDRREEIPAVLHPADDTTRPQTVTETQHPRYHALLSAFESRTGVPVLLNTSFNDKGEPIVNTPQEAIKDFFGMGLDLLAIEDIVIEKTPQIR
jgi:carbamoyltransferase